MSERDDTADFSVNCADLNLCRGGRRVLTGVGLRFSSRECLALIGPNGAGKTSLLLALLGLLPPETGAAMLCLAGRADTALHRVSARRRARLFAYLPQSPESVPPHLVYDIVAGGRYVHGRPLEPLRDADHRAIRAALAAVDLEPLAERPLNELSGGERQKALLAAALAQDAQMLFLDEPTAALDPAYQAVLVARLAAWRAAGRGIVLVSHDLQVPAVLDARVVALRDGRMLADGAAEEILRPERLRAVYAAEFDVVATAGGRRIVVPSWWQ